MSRLNRYFPASKLIPVDDFWQVMVANLPNIDQRQQIDGAGRYKCPLEPDCISQAVKYLLVASVE
jgi:hypothetical protein